MSMYTVYGATTSPYVRRLRIMMRDLDFELKHLSIFDPNDRKELKQLSPVMKVPVLKINQDSQLLYDSRAIFNYLNRKHFKQEISLADENIMTVIDGINDSMVILVMMGRFGMEVNEEMPYIKVQRERVIEGFDYLNSLWTEDRRWDYPAICLYSLIDWAMFRSQLHSLDRWSKLANFFKAHQNLPEVMSTDPRL